MLAQLTHLMGLLGHQIFGDKHHENVATSDPNHHESAAMSASPHRHIICVQGFVTFQRSLTTKNCHHKLVTMQESSQNL